MPIAHFWRDKNVLVTGASGFLGSWLTEALIDAQANVVGLIRDRQGPSRYHSEGLRESVTEVYGGVENYELMERSMNEYEIEIVFHIAAQPLVTVSNRNPLSTFESNIKGTWTVLEACRRSSTVKRLVIASSDKAYGEVKGRSYKENGSALGAQFPYDVSKACADLIAQSYYRTFNLPVAVTRCGNLFGGGDLYFDRIIPGTIRSVLRNEPPIIRSDGTYVRDYFFVKDAAAACLQLAQELHRKELWGQAFNFSGNNPKSVLAVTQQVLRLMKSDLKPKILNQARHEIKHQTLSTDKASRLLKWRPQYPFGEALQETINWYRNYFNGSSRTA
ncbi:MAG: NAD-dependent epimerase/dehydratase family protein [Elusimicrobia bacterium]|nr:NAD-dependent epimerase/dehydratase family protein [Elusimicrobiota bacterium]